MGKCGQNVGTSRPQSIYRKTTWTCARHRSSCATQASKPPKSTPEYPRSAERPALTPWTPCARSPRSQRQGHQISWTPIRPSSSPEDLMEERFQRIDRVPVMVAEPVPHRGHSGSSRRSHRKCARGHPDLRQAWTTDIDQATPPHSTRHRPRP